MDYPERTPYEILGLPKDFKAEALRKRYRRLCMQFHPDRNPGNTEAEKKFLEVGLAHSILSDDQARSAYDRYGYEMFEYNWRKKTGGTEFGLTAYWDFVRAGFDFSGITIMAEIARQNVAAAGKINLSAFTAFSTAMSEIFFGGWGQTPRSTVPSVSVPAIINAQSHMRFP